MSILWIIISLAILGTLLIGGVFFWDKIQWERYKQQHWNQMEKECSYIEKHGTEEPD